MVSSVFRHLVNVLASCQDPCSICCILHSLHQHCCGCQGPGAVLIQQYTLSVYVLVYHVPVFCLLFCCVGFLSLRIAVLGVSSPQPQLQGLFCRVYFSKLPLQHWVGQLGELLASWGVTVVAAPGPLGHPASICDVGVNLILSYLFGIFRQAGSVWLLKAGLNVGLYK